MKFLGGRSIHEPKLNWDRVVSSYAGQKRKQDGPACDRERERVRERGWSGSQEFEVRVELTKTIL